MKDTTNVLLKWKYFAFKKIWYNMIQYKLLWMKNTSLKKRNLFFNTYNTFYITRDVYQEFYEYSMLFWYTSHKHFAQIRVESQFR